MTVGEILNLITTRLGNVSISNNRSVLLSYLNMGISELYRRFGLSVREEVVETCFGKRLYELHSDDVLMLHAVYDSHGREIPQMDTLDDKGLFVKRVNYRSFIISEPIDSHVFCIYKAAPFPLKDDEDELDIPDPMIDVLENYVAYKVFSLVNQDNSAETSLYRKITEQLLMDLENQGYGALADTEKFSLHRRGMP